MTNPIVGDEVTIANGQTKSDPVTISNHLVRSFIFPTGWTTYNVTFEGLYAPNTEAGNVTLADFVPILDSGGNTITLTTPAAGEAYALTPLESIQLSAFTHIRLVSATSQSGGDIIKVGLQNL